MSLERFKTQILLLHSEQSTLDSLSTGFNDRYEVHCATSGSEALSTLGQTQIDVIVTAQDLPGMSGLDALKEAKKRSPETIGILIASNNADGNEALVGAEEVFQIVRGGVTPEKLVSLVDGATQQSRLMALAESANDTTANPDEPSPEHIVMETSENGSTIISDGTGRMPALNPEKVSAAANVGSRGVDILVLTKDDEFLSTVKESARGLHNVIYANTLAQADEAVRDQKVGVAVVDAAMVGDNVEKLTVHLRSSVPRLVAIVAGRRDDGEMLMDLINRGKVYRFLLKPVSPGRARLAIEASVKHHLEAPDSAFKIAGGAAAKKAPAKPAPKAAPKPEPKPEPKAEAKPKPEAKAAPKPEKPTAEAATDASQSVPKIVVEPRPVPPADDASPIDDGLGDAFGGDDTSFTETMTGIVKSVGESIASVTSRDEETELAPEAAAPSSLEIDGGGSMFSDPKVLGGIAAAVVVVGAIGWFAMSGSNEPAAVEATTATTESTPAPTITEAMPDFTSPATTTQSFGAGDLLDEARLAADAGQIYNPAGSNAIELYLAAAEAAPDDATIAAELAVTVEQALSMAENALLERRAEDASAALSRVALADAENSRLPFLTAQLSQMQLRDYLDSSRQAIRESRFEDASVALDGARALNIDGADAEIAAVATELSDALSEQQVDEVLAKANARLDEGLLTTPSNDNARYYYELALSNDPGNTAARNGLVVIAGKLVMQARSDIDAGNFDSAEVVLADARRLDPGSSELAATAQALTDARNAIEQQRLAAQRAAEERAAAERAAAERLAAEQAAADAAAAERLAAEQAAAQAAAREPETTESAPAERTAVTEPPPSNVVTSGLGAGAAATAATATQPVANAAENLGGATTSLPVEAAPTTPAVPFDGTVNESTEPVPISALTRTKYVAPRYPRSAQRRNVSGWVDVVFTVDFDGSVKDIAVINSEPGLTFVSSAVAAVEDWEFEPSVESGQTVQKRAAVRMSFALE
ncbi:MAG: TonB family protein [Pseudomonadota bacterium]